MDTDSKFAKEGKTKRLNGTPIYLIHADPNPKQVNKNQSFVLNHALSASSASKKRFKRLDGTLICLMYADLNPRIIFMCLNHAFSVFNSNIVQII